MNLWKLFLSLIHISEPTRLLSISYAVFCLKFVIPRFRNTYLVAYSAFRPYFFRITSRIWPISISNIIFQYIRFSMIFWIFPELKWISSKPVSTSVADRFLDFYFYKRLRISRRVFRLYFLESYSLLKYFFWEFYKFMKIISESVFYWFRDF